jgi:hypothetical protein
MFRLKKGFIVRKIGEQIMAVPIGTQTSEIHGMIALSESAELLWNALEDGSTIEEMTRILTENYEIDCESAQRDVTTFIEQLKSQGALQ